ncbi:hypothetical protein H5410_064075 [Solanum commersonii]|uniref:Uncharacterized protein n=1 Tax=Solanum commersonii TaxID=4109 RepID=A0A9J5W0L2_SOLCO|nr:hypothetical protein H5410_064075 [Solanum commersonii]
MRTSVKTLPMKPVGPHGQNDPFSRSNDPRSKILTSSSEQVNPHFVDFRVLYSMNFWVIWNSKLIFDKILPGRPLRSYLRRQLTITA